MILSALHARRAVSPRDEVKALRYPNRVFARAGVRLCACHLSPVGLLVFRSRLAIASDLAPHRSWTLLRLHLGPLPWEPCAGRPVGDILKAKLGWLAKPAEALAAAGAAGFMADFFGALLPAAAAGDYGAMSAAVAAAWGKGAPRKEFGGPAPPAAVAYRW
jgi:hypothetical protein